MPRDPVLVNNPFMEETDDKFRKIFFGNTKEKTEDTSESAAENKEEIHSDNSDEDHSAETPVPASSVSEKEGKNVSENTHKSDNSATETKPEEQRLKKRLERHNFKIYNTQVQKLRDVARHLKEVRGDEVKADMSGILRYLVDSLDLDQLTEEYPKRP